MLVPIDDNVKLPARIYTSPNVDYRSKIPTVFYVPGTGFIANETKYTHVFCTHICNMVKCQVIVLNHRLAPENQFPTGSSDCYKLFKFFVTNSLTANLINKEKIVVAGYSSGGNFAAQIAIQAKKDKIPLARQILISPLVDLSRSLTGFEEFQNKDKDISEEFVNWVISLYLPSPVNPRNPKASPFFWEDSDVKGLPPTDIIFAQFDRCKSDAVYYAGKLTKQEVPVKSIEVLEETSAYLWQNQKVAHIVTDRLSYTFSNEYIPKPLDNSVFLVSVSEKDFLIKDAGQKAKEEAKIQEIKAILPRAKL